MGHQPSDAADTGIKTGGNFALLTHANFGVGVGEMYESISRVQP